jgi:Xaa-Pro aminopeptidase
MLAADGTLTVVVPPTMQAIPSADRVLAYQAQRHSTLRNDQRQASSAVLLEAIETPAAPPRIGVEFSSFPPHLSAPLAGQLVDIEPELYRLRRRKDPDELACIRTAIAATGAMYETAREIVEPGINELEVFNQLQATAVRVFGEMTTATGNDYQCGQRGGPPRDRAAEAGELYILDLGPAYRGYFADNCRTVAVDRRPTDEQHQAWAQLAAVFPMVEADVRPGASARELFEKVNAHLAESTLGVFDHHLGHGIGLFPHEAPHLNPHWDDRFEEGDVFTAEPGLYAESLRAGIRLENNYRVSATGVELLSDFPLEL